jgi:hypothetical protein
MIVATSATSSSGLIEDRADRLGALEELPAPIALGRQPRDLRRVGARSTRTARVAAQRPQISPVSTQ